MNDVARTLREAWEAVETAKIPETLRSIAFERAIDLLSGDRDLPHVLSHPPVSSTTPDQALSPETSDWRQLISEKLAITPQEVGDLFTVTDGRVEIHLQTGRLSTSKKGGAEEIVLLFVAAKAALGQVATNAELRTAADYYSKLDGNFPNYIKGLSGELKITKVSARKYQYGMKAAGFDKAKEIAQKMIG